MGETVFLLEGEGVEVCPQTQRPGAGSAPQDADNASPCNPGVDGQTPGLQAFGDETRSSVLLKAQFRVGMDIPSQAFELRKILERFE